jgi:hypothetical protein
MCLDYSRQRTAKIADESHSAAAEWVIAHTETKKNSKLDYRHEILSESGLTPRNKKYTQK